MAQELWIALDCYLELFIRTCQYSTELVFSSFVAKIDGNPQLCLWIVLVGKYAYIVHCYKGNLQYVPLAKFCDEPTNLMRRWRGKQGTKFTQTIGEKFVHSQHTEYVDVWIKQ